jgi:maltose alpha-D-glucosyltransferase/alpha-amylase
MDMLFNFVLNQALYLAFVRHDATPVTDALRALPAIPPQGQWANFIKNHDEASLDKLTDAEREEVFAAFAPKTSMRLFERGIRRRFPTMVDGDRRRVELAYSLLFALPGTPVLFYGEEIGLGDNQAMPDRAAVRPPMAWSDRPGGGFSEADEARLPRKLVRDGPFGYRERNVEEQRRDPGSLLNWMELAIRSRKEWPAIGWGQWQVLGTRSRRVLAHLARWDGTAVLAVHNFSDEPERISVRLPKDAVDGRWTHVFGRGASEAPQLERGGLTCEIEPYGYHWFGAREGV